MGDLNLSEDYEHLTCLAVARSIGSNVFFEFGTDETDLFSKSKNLPEGDLSIWVATDVWEVRFNDVEVLCSETVSDREVATFFEKYKHCLRPPIIDFGRFGALRIKFSDEISLFSWGFTSFEDWPQAEREAYEAEVPPEARMGDKDHGAEVIVRYPDGKYTSIRTSLIFAEDT